MTTIRSIEYADTNRQRDMSDREISCKEFVREHADNDSATAAPHKTPMRKVALASMAGATLEWYDFTLYNAMAALIFNRLFFPSYAPLVGTILAFSTYAVGYISRPIGGVVFGWAGDRFGRKVVLLVTLLMMGASSFAIGVLPTYAGIGVTAPILLVSLRFFQGIALGGDWAAAVLLSSEHGAKRKRGLNASFAQIGPAAGTLLATGTLWVVTATLTEAQFAGWGWRVPFLLSVLLVLVGAWVRRSIRETPDFEKSLAARKQIASPVIEVFRAHRRSLLVAGGVRIGSDVLYALMATFSLTYVAQVLGLPKSYALGGVLAGAACQLVLVPFFGALSDGSGRRVVYAIGITAAVLSASTVFALLETRSPFLIVVAQIFGLAAHAAMYGVQAALVTEQFDASVRSAGASLAYTFAGVIGGGFAPLIITSLFRHYDSTGPIVVYVVAALGVSAIALAYARRTD